MNLTTRDAMPTIKIEIKPLDEEEGIGYYFPPADAVYLAKDHPHIVSLLKLPKRQSEPLLMQLAIALVAERVAFSKEQCKRMGLRSDRDFAAILGDLLHRLHRVNDEQTESPRHRKFANKVRPFLLSEDRPVC